MLPAGSSHSGAGPLGPLPHSCCSLSLGEMGAPREKGAGASWLAAMHLQGLKVTLECAWTGLQVGSSFPCDLGQVTSSLVAAFSCVQMACTCRQMSRPDRAGLVLDLGKMPGNGYRSQRLG